MMTMENYTANELQVGQQASFSKMLTVRDIALFAECSGDVNPVHLDESYAATTPFGEPIGHGMWTGALISAAIATRLPGPGSVYRSQSITFKSPVKVGDTVTVLLTVEEIKARIGLVVIQCEAHNQNGQLIAKGVAEVIAPKEKQSLAAGVVPRIIVG